jgi:hypothetical protein
MDITQIASHADTTRQDIHETTRQLLSHLGLTAVSFLSGAKDSKQASRWAKAESSEPRPETRKRLLAAHRIWTDVSTAESDYIARNWFIGANPRLGEISPLEALRDGNVQEVLDAAAAFVSGTDG